MMRRKWLFWLSDEDENFDLAASSHAETEACREWTPFLTALFDGEADEDGALRARRHLLVCERCARAWLDWNQTRSLLINHSAPPPPPSLLWRIRLACRLGKPEPVEPAAPQLAGQIFALTSRKAAKPVPSFASLLPVPRGWRLNAPFLGALAMGAFVLVVARDALLTSVPPAPLAKNSASIVGRNARSQTQASARVASSQAMQGKVRIQNRPSAPRQVEQRDEEQNQPRPLTVATHRQPRGVEQNELSSLERARRERESLSSSPVRLASFNASEPLPMLPAPKPIAVVTREQPKPVRQVVRPPRLARLPRIAPRPVASAPHIEMPSVVLASFDTSSAPTPEPTSAPAPRLPRAGRTLLASAPLRASTPHALPITVSQPSSSDSDDAGLDELDSTVQEYRATLISDDSSDFANDAG